MSNIINQAQKGNAEAMLALYNNNKEKVLFLCTLLLSDMNAACNATSRTFRNMWDLVIAGEIKTEEAFSKTVIEKAVSSCKSSASKKDAKAFRNPVNNNFNVKNYSAGKIVDDKERALFLIHNLPPLQRFICVLNTFFGYDERRLAQMFKISEKNVKFALEAEEANLESYLSLYKKLNGEEGSYSADEFHRELESIGEAVVVPNGVNTTVLLGIDSVCEPILKRAKKARNKIFINIGAGLLCACFISLAVWGIISAANSTNNDYNSGYSEGYDYGYDDGYSEGYDDGYDEGYSGDKDEADDSTEDTENTDEIN